jgi:hypothetical protein
MDWSPRSRTSNRCSRSPAPPEKGHRRAEIRCRLAEIRCRNPVSAHHSCPQGKSGVREIRCQFIILARKDEPTPDYARKDEPTPDYACDPLRCWRNQSCRPSEPIIHPTANRAVRAPSEMRLCGPNDPANKGLTAGRGDRLHSTCNYTPTRSRRVSRH